jgi:hypothetical protein
LKLIRELRKKYKNLFLSTLIKDTNENYLDLDARLLLGRIYIQERLYARALHEMNFIIKHQSNLFMAYYIQGLANEALGYDKAAFIDYEYTLRYNSNHEGAASRLKELLKRGVSP